MVMIKEAGGLNYQWHLPGAVVGIWSIDKTVEVRSLQMLKMYILSGIMSLPYL